MGIFDISGIKVRRCYSLGTICVVYTTNFTQKVTTDCANRQTKMEKKNRKANANWVQPTNNRNLNKHKLGQKNIR